MLSLDAIRPRMFLRGVLSDQIVQVIALEPAGPDAATLYFKGADGRPSEQFLSRADEAKLDEAVAEQRPWTFTGDASQFILATEAHRIRLAHLFDPMMAVHTSDVEPLPHQITAVYETMLPRQPLRFVLADDPGAGKTIMAGLLIRELTMRADAQRVLIVAPGSLVEQWQDELLQKFGLEFTIFSRDLINQSPTGNAFAGHDRLIARLDQLSRNCTSGKDEPPGPLEELLDASRWDLIIVDEAHKMAAHWSGQEVKPSDRYRLGMKLGKLTRHFLLMTATPHNGKEEDFQLFMSLLDSERFDGKFRDGVHRADVSDLMRRMVKEDLRTFDNRPLFPERKPYTVLYDLSPAEQALYDAVTQYVENEMDKADLITDGRRRSVAGFALTSLQRRLASSPGAIYKSLRRRRERLEERVVQELARVGADGSIVGSFTSFDLPDDLDEDLPAGEYEESEDDASTRTTAARTVKELEEEVSRLLLLEEQARKLRESQEDCKWEKLSGMLQSNPLIKDESGRPRKLIIFTEYRDTLLYLQDRIQGLIGDAEAVVVIDGSTPRDVRRQVQDRFRQDDRVRVLLATDAAGEGVNLQTAHLMVNYDLPWNPNRLEQRFGRIHRIGQTEVCHLWNLVAKGTREGSVYERLLMKLETISQDLQGRVFDVLGEVFEGKPLRELLVEAIRYGDQPEVRSRLNRQMDTALDEDHLRSVITRNALCEEIFGTQRLHEVREQMEQAEARKLQPYFVQDFVKRAFRRLGGELREQETGRFKISYVPVSLRDHDRQLGSADRRLVLDRYDRVCFEKKLMRPQGKAAADLLHPGHPFVRALTSLTVQQCLPALRQGAVLVDPNDDGEQPRLLFLMDHVIREADATSGAELSRRLHFVSIAPNGVATAAGWAPHLDLQPLPEELETLADPYRQQDWLARPDLEQLALRYAAAELVPAHLLEVRARREEFVDKTYNAVYERLTRELEYWDDQVAKAQSALEAGKSLAPANLAKAEQNHESLLSRRTQRLAELRQMRHVVSATPIVMGGALVLPAGLVARLTGQEEFVAFAADAAARARTEMLAMQAVFNAEKALGHITRDVSAARCGWDITATLPIPVTGRLPAERHLEVKGIGVGNDTVILTRNEIHYGLNQHDKFVLALVLVHPDGSTQGPFYVQQPFTSRDTPAEGSVHSAYQLKHFLNRAVSPALYYDSFPL